MTERRMISRKIIDTGAFVDMPMTSRLLYYELNWRADDDGFIASPKKITRSCGCSDDDLRILISKQFIIPFESGVVLIKDWRIHNYIRCDRYTETLFTDEKEQIAIDGNNRYLKCHTSGIPNVIPDVIPLVATGKDRLGKDRIESLSPDEPKETAIAVVDKKSEFNKFWQLYPRKQSKASALKSWNKVKPLEYDKTFESLPVFIKSEQWTKSNGEFIPYPATWLNQQRWNDEVSKSSKPCISEGKKIDGGWQL